MLLAFDASKHEEGETVTVWVDPRNPSTSALNREAVMSTVLASLGTLLLVIAALIAVL